MWMCLGAAKTEQHEEATGCPETKGECGLCCVGFVIEATHSKAQELENALAQEKLRSLEVRRSCKFQYKWNH